jgi:hypothetical protein
MFAGWTRNWMQSWEAVGSVGPSGTGQRPPCQSVPVHENEAGAGRGSHNSAMPRSVDELACDSAWTVSRNASAGRWSTAERIIAQGDHHWQIGLTPVTTTTTALIRWLDGAVVAHRRGDEAELCSTALRWISDLERETPVSR